MLLESAVAALIPVVAEGLRAGASKIFGNVKPLTIEDQIKLDANEVEKLKALATLDNPGGTPSQWVVDLRGSARYVSAGIVIIGGFGTLFMSGLSETVQVLGLEAANVAFGFLFGTRIVASWRK
jgi:hypothetical protein